MPTAAEYGKLAEKLELPATDGESTDVGKTEFARGKDATHPFGVLYQGEWETPWDGTTTAVRLHARALAAAGLPVLLRSFSGTVINADGVAEPAFVAGVPASVRREIGTLNQTSIGTLAVMIKHAVVRDAAHLRRILVPRHVVDSDSVRLLALRTAVLRATILYSVWERDRVDPEIARGLGRAGACWVPCEQNRDLLAASGVPAERVEVVPHPYDPEGDLAPLVQRKASPDAGRRFYSIGRWEPRKGYVRLIQAFLFAFRPTDDATLTIKYSGGNWPDYPSPEEALRDSVARASGWTLGEARRRIHLIGERIRRSHIVKLHFDHNIYVSASHGEAWGLPAFEAKVSGNRLVHVPYGGTPDFAGPDDIEVPWRFGPVDESYGWEPGALWADYGLQDLALALARVRAPERYERPPRFDERFSLAAVGRQMRALALDVARGAMPKAADYLASCAPGDPA